jgi:glycosyltransferase involved in cell wall biosynthesis
VLHEARLQRVLRRLEPDILHAHDSNALLPVAVAARSLGVPFVLDAHELWLGRPPGDRPAWYRLAYHAWYTVLEQLLVPRAAAHLTVSAPIARHYERVYRLPTVELVPNYPDVGRPIVRREIRDLVPELPPAVPIVLHLGAFMPDRGLEQVVEALRDVPDAHLVILGAGSRGPELARFAARHGVGERVHPLAPVPSDEVIGYAASATIGVAPIVPTTLNNRYSLPNKLFQYMAAGLPVLASALPQMTEIVEGSEAGVTVDTRDVRAIAAALRRLFDDPAGLGRMGASARRAVEDRYNWSTSASTLLSVYARLVSRGPGLSPNERGNEAGSGAI